MPTAQSPEDEIRTAAFYIWLEEGRPEGRAEAHWEMACARLAAGAAKPKRKRAAAAKTAKPAKPRAAKSAKAATAAETAEVPAPRRRKPAAKPKAKTEPEA